MVVRGTDPPAPTPIAMTLERQFPCSLMAARIDQQYLYQSYIATPPPVDPFAPPTATGCGAEKMRDKHQAELQPEAITPHTKRTQSRSKSFQSQVRVALRRSSELALRRRHQQGHGAIYLGGGSASVVWVRSATLWSIRSTRSRGLMVPIAGTAGTDICVTVGIGACVTTPVAGDSRISLVEAQALRAPSTSGVTGLNLRGER